MAKCNLCSVEIAWKREWIAGRSQWVKYLPQRDEAGQIVKASKPNGGGRTVMRAVPSGDRHTCPEGTPVPEAKAPESKAWCGVTIEPRGWCCSLEPGHSGDHVAFSEHDATRPELARMPQRRERESAPVPPYGKPEPTPVDFYALRGMVRAEMKAILDEYGVEQPPRILKIEAHGKTFESQKGEILHQAVDRLVTLLADPETVHVYLHGPAGSGKTFGACQGARLVGREAIVISMPGLTHAKLLGYAKPDGGWVRTAFVEAFEHGKVAVLDEFDRSLPAVAAAFNSALENGVLIEGERSIPMHKDFAVVATGNTDMRGATRTYTSAQPLDLATAARFAFVAWGYDETHEDSLVRSVLPVPVAKKLVTWCRKVRGQMAHDRIDTAFCGPREALRIARDVKRGTPIEVAAHSWIWRGLDSTTVERIVKAYPYPTLTEVKRDPDEVSF